MPEKAERGRAVDAGRVELADQVVGAGDRRVIEMEQQVAEADAGALSRTAGFDLADPHCPRARAGRERNPARHRHGLCRDAEMRTADAAMRDTSPITNSAVLLDTAKHSACAPPIIAVLIPTTSPDAETSGPPELPGLSAASVWITSSINRPLRPRSERPRAETTPAVTVELEPERIADRDDQLATPEPPGIAEPDR